MSCGSVEVRHVKDMALDSANGCCVSNNDGGDRAEVISYEEDEFIVKG